MTEYDYRDPSSYQTPTEPLPIAEPYRPGAGFSQDRFTQDPFAQGDPYRYAGPTQDSGSATPGGYRQQMSTQPYPPYPYLAPEHPQGSTVLILGVLSLVFAPLGFVAWYLGSRAQREIAETGAVYSNTGNVTAGKIIGMVTSILTMAGGAFFVLYIALMMIMFLGAASF